MSWAVEAGGDDVRHALSAVRDARPMEDTGASSSRDLSRHGLLTERAHRDAGAILAEQALPRFDALVG
jgi:hypothetical protein